MLRTTLLLTAAGLGCGALALVAAGNLGPAASSSHGGLAAFPGAEGFGTGTPGGRGGAVCLVTNLYDSGAGSLRDCVDAEGPRYVVFRVGGTIELHERLTVEHPYLTIAGQTAPGDGITLRMDPESGTDQGTLLVTTHDVVVRYVRFRPGDGGAGDDSHDGVTIYEHGAHHVVIDHVSVSWAIDENVNTYDDSADITISNSIISEALSNAGHPKGEHSKGMLSGGRHARNVSIHHNLFVSNVDRNPQVSGVSVADVRNNVVYNYGDGAGDGTTLLSSTNGAPLMNWVGNYYKPGPDSPTDRPEFATYLGDTGASHHWYGDGNVRWTPEGDEEARVAEESSGETDAPFEAPPVTTTSAREAFRSVLRDAGASLVRDDVDLRLVREVRTGEGALADEGGPWPDLAAGTPPVDSDGDGMPDEFEVSHGTDPQVPDAVGDVDGNGYDDIEDWFNGLVAPTDTAATDPDQ